ncbi:Actin-related protein 2, partial [Dissostichus eleginoides]
KIHSWWERRVGHKGGKENKSMTDCKSLKTDSESYRVFQPGIVEFREAGRGRLLKFDGGKAAHRNLRNNSAESSEEFGSGLILTGQ